MTETFVNGVMVSIGAATIVLVMLLACNALTEATTCSRVVRELTIAGQADAIAVLVKAGTCGAK